MYMYNYCFQVPVLKAGNGLTVRGLVSVAKQIVRQSESPELKGRHGFEKRLTYKKMQQLWKLGSC